MTRAWAIIKRMEGQVRSNFSKALKLAGTYAKAHTDEILNGWNITKLTKAGANRWTKYGKDRMYIKRIGGDLVGLGVVFGKKGRIKNYTMGGEDLSDGFASRVMRTYAYAYIDLKTGEVCDVDDCTDLTQEFMTKLTAAFGA